MYKQLAAAAAIVVAVPLALLLLATAAAAPGGSGAGAGAGAGLAGGPSPLALAGIPPAYLVLYLDAAQTCPGLPWGVLAGIGTAESDNGQSRAPGVAAGANFAGAYDRAAAGGRTAGSLLGARAGLRLRAGRHHLAANKPASASRGPRLVDIRRTSAEP